MNRAIAADEQHRAPSDVGGVVALGALEQLEVHARGGGVSVADLGYTYSTSPLEGSSIIEV
jgi:hypothetical protein